MGNITQLELKHLAAYLPYGFTCLIDQKIVFIAGAYNLNNKLNVVSDAGNDFDTSIWAVKPILRPLSYLGTYLPTINTNVDFEINSDAQIIIDLDDYQRAYVPLESYLHHVKFLLANHFDVFGLIDAGLAIDINTIQP